VLKATSTDDLQIADDGQVTTERLLDARYQSAAQSVAAAIKNTQY
jgi:hypothetical protein